MAKLYRRYFRMYEDTLKGEPTMRSRIRLPPHALIIEITIVMPEPRHCHHQVQTDTDMIIVTQIGTSPCMLHR